MTTLPLTDPARILLSWPLQECAVPDLRDFRVIISEMPGGSNQRRTFRT
jgi:hypothetical protein